jgi:hypothetical protein
MLPFLSEGTSLLLASDPVYRRRVIIRVVGEARHFAFSHLDETASFEVEKCRDRTPLRFRWFPLWSVDSHSAFKEEVAEGASFSQRFEDFFFS